MAIIAGVVLNMGSLIQKKAVNQFVYIKKKSITVNDSLGGEKYPTCIFV